MIVGDLLHSRVLTQDGVRLGFITDVRLSVEVWDEGDETERCGKAAVVGILVSPRTGSTFLGYERRDVRAPWVVAALVRRRHRGTFLLPWEDLASSGQGWVRAAPGFRRLDPGLL